MCKKLLVFLLAFGLGITFIRLFDQKFDTDYVINEEQTLAISEQKSRTNLNSTKSVDLSISSDSNKSRFFAAGVEDDNEVIDFYLKFQKAVAENDKTTVSTMVIYPLRVNFPTDSAEKKYTFIKSRKELLKNYDKIFDSNLKEFIAKIDVEKTTKHYEDIWAKSDGIAVGRGVIWIGVYCIQRYCEDNKHYIKIRTIHGNSNIMDLDKNDAN